MSDQEEFVSDEEVEKRKSLVTKIIQAMAASGSYVPGDLFFTLIFTESSELRRICKECNVNPD